MIEHDEGDEHLPPWLLHLPLPHQPIYRFLSQNVVSVKNLLKLFGKCPLKLSRPVRSQSWARRACRWSCGPSWGAPQCPSCRASKGFDTPGDCEDNLDGEDNDDISGAGDDVEDGVDFPQRDFNLLNQDVIKNHQPKISAHLACVDICEELVDFDEGFLLLRVFYLVGDAKVDSECEIPER